MRQGFLGMTMALLLGGAVWMQAAHAQQALPPEPGIEATIQSQIDAFLKDDFATAFTFASPSIQMLFGSPERFGAMVRQGYPMVWRPGDVRFGDLREIGGALWQKVIVVDADGETHVLDYRMVMQGGDWRISGVQILPQPDVSA
ncbi:DUF4864 domain-containing protein [Thalassococcus sp. CAU 1522]|uniref:DUF4864 domain-containing protein n=1 Tax=Thalassococcus arenae TaxID=2851652 RepID=A0ABS6N426_9RHOB|nr:DUF4864 domain-containing protein [Thalassococcus arenae]MBV2358774.1 DUF4864 domain-containing protein [Thalassococcus arenae]